MISIVGVSPNVDLDTKERTIPRCDFQYNSSYSPDYSTFANLPTGRRRKAGLQTTNFTSRHNGFSKQKILLSKINLIFMIQDVFLGYQRSTYLTMSSLGLLVYEFLQMYVRHNSFSKQKILLSKINLIFIIQDEFSYQIPRMSTYLTVSSLRSVLYEFSPNIYHIFQTGPANTNGPSDIYFRDLHFMTIDLTKHTHHSAWHIMQKVICGGAKYWMTNWK